MNNQTFFVPMSFSAGSYKAVEYATRLAKSFKSKLVLFHVVDAGEITESDNAPVVRRSMDRLVGEATNRLSSFAEMIAETHNVTIDYSVSIGNIQNEVLDEVSLVKPNLIFLGKNSSDNSMIRKLMSWLNVPVIVVPFSADTREPSKMVLTTDLNPVKHEALTMAIDISKKTTETLALLHIQKNGSSGKTKWAEHFSENFGVQSEFFLKKNPHVIEGILDHATLNRVDLVCTVKRRKGLIASLFSQSISTQLALKAEVPTLVIPEDYVRFHQPKRQQESVEV